MSVSTMKRSLNINCDEKSLRSAVDKTTDECPGIGINTSHLDCGESGFKVLFSCNNKDVLNKAEAVFRYLLPSNALILPNNDAIGFDALIDYGEEHENVKKSISLIDKSLNDYKPEELCISFNGGKDCTALLHMVYTIFITKFPTNKLNVFYIEMPETFSLLENFVKLTINRYNLNLMSFPGPNYKIALEMLKESTDIKGIFMGTRISDLPKGCHLVHCQPTDQGWPQFMRINPLLHWSYTQVWSFIRDMDVPYCSLYDRGYTSIGSAKNTNQNPFLKFESKSGDIYYMPAYMLTDEGHERTGRTQ